MKAIRLNLFLGGAALLLLGSSCCLGIMLGLPLSDMLFEALGAESGASWKTEFALAAWAIVLPILWTECGFFWIRKLRTLHDIEGGYPTANIWTRIAKWLLPLEILLSATLIVAAALLLLVETAVFIMLMLRDPEMMIRPVVIMGAILSAYAFLRTAVWIFWRHWGSKAARRYSLGLAKYRLAAEGVEVDLNYALELGPRGPRKFFVGFDELEEVRTMTYVETSEFLHHVVGPNIELALREYREVFAWRSGNIPRPAVHISTARSVFGTKVLLRGSDLFYLISFHGGDGHDLVEAFRRARESDAHPADRIQ
ncbi:MAG: hypothetical protein JW929_12890 [Anaerolineales bacterium]|nr:hypothetical protein [Anaerolineales bacterium]